MNLAMGTFTLLDWVVLAGYLVGITCFGLWMSRKTKSSSSYFLGEQKLPWWVMVGQAFSTGTHAENAVGQAGATYQFGFSTIWYQWKNMLITPFYWLMSPWYRRSGCTTVGEMVEQRYSRGMGLIYTIFAIGFLVCNQGNMLKAAGKVISAAVGGQYLTPNGVVLLMAAVFILYSFLGGLVSTAYTEFVQGFLIILLSFMLIPLGLWRLGGFSGLRATIPPDFFYLYSEASKMNAFTIAMLALNGIIGITAMPHMMSMHATGKSERSGRVGMTYGTMVKRFCTIGWALTGLIVAALAVKQSTHFSDPEHAFGYACRELLGPGMLGLMVACLLAANMGGCSNSLVNIGALFACNFYKHYIKPAASDRDMLRTGRISGLLLSLLGLLYALRIDQVLDAFMFTETLAAFIGIMFLGGVLWKRANRHAAMVSTVGSVLLYYVLNAWKVGELKLLYHWEAGPFGWTMLAGAVAFIVVSLLTRPEDDERLARFFDKMRYSSDGEAPPAGQSKPLAAERGRDMLLLDVPGWFRRERWQGFFHRYREDLVGFVAAWGMVGGLVLFAWAIMQIGK